MKKFEYGQLCKRIDNDSFAWVLYSKKGAEKSFKQISLLEALNVLGKEGWQVAFHLSTGNQQVDIYLQRELET